MKVEIKCSVKSACRFLVLHFLLCSLFTASNLFAEIMPANLFADQMVVQRGVRVPVWGTATADERTVTLSFKGQSVSGPVVGGKWKVLLEPMPADAQPAVMSIRGQKTAGMKIKDVLVGEVWLASGQSNMEFRMNSFAKHLPETAEDIKNADYPAMRYIKINTRAYAEEKTAIDTGWNVCSPSSAGGFSATAFYFARELLRETGVPVGIINCSWSGSSIVTWMPEEGFLADPDLKTVIDQYRGEVAKHTPEEYEKMVMAVEEKDRLYTQKQREGVDRKTLGKRPKVPMGPKCRTRPCAHYDVMLRPLVPYALKGFIWYQGETDGNSFKFDVSGPYLYRKMLSTLINGWRKDWGDAALPFLFVQLPSWKGKMLDGNDDYQGWAELRDSQVHVLKNVPHTGMAVTIDIGDLDNIHPPKKEPVGKRLARCAQGVAYGNAENYSAGPMYRSHRQEENKIVVSFDYVESGLRMKNPASGFLICGPDKKFIPAHAQAEGDTVLVWHDTIENPVAVRYGWKNFFESVLFDEAGLPASPFRTDSFKLISQP